MNKILTVARREYIETVKTRTFQLMVFGMPFIIILIVLISSLVQDKIVSGAAPERRVAVVDLTGELLPKLESSFREHNESNPERRILLEPSQVEQDGLEAQTQRLKEKVRDRKLDAFLLIPEGVIEGTESPQYYRRADEMADFKGVGTIRHLLNDAVTDRRCVLHDISPDLVAKILERVPLQQMDVAQESDKEIDSFSPKMFVPFFFLFLMFMGVFGVNQQMLTSVIEEKTSRVVEVLLSVVTPFQFMAGKIIGLTAIGLTVVGIWGVAAYGTAVYYDLTGAIHFTNLIYFFLYFILGFALFSSVFAAIGSACNTIQEAQSLMMPISFLLILPMMGWMYFVQNPNSAWAIGLSFVPPLTPLVMTLRLAVRPDLPVFQIFASLFVLGLSVPLVMWASGKIFRIGILMYGKPPSLREMLRWVRTQ